jgi:hypothetical protein
MNRISILLICLLAFTTSSGKSQTDSILQVLDREIDNRGFYYQKKEDRLNTLKALLDHNQDAQVKFDFCNRLFNEYITYQYDSACVYAQKNLDIAAALNDEKLIVQSKLNILQSHVLAGLHKESFELLNTMDPETMPDNLKILYYRNCLRFYQDLLIYSRGSQFQNKYIDRIFQYCDSLMSCLKPNTFEYDYYDTVRCTDENTRIEKYLQILDKYSLSLHDYAVVYANLADNTGDMEKAIYYASLSSIYDIRASIRETTSKQTLGRWLYHTGNIDFASKCIQIALEDAIFYNNFGRKIEISTILPVIEKEKLNLVESAKDKLSKYLLAVSALLFIVFVLLLVILNQTKKLKKTRALIQNQYDELYLINTKLDEANKELEKSGHVLKELNAIKDMYIIQSLYGKYEYIERFDNLLKKVHTKIIAKQYDDLSHLYKDFNIKKERENMYSSFDKTFLILFPNFITEYNKLFAPQDHVSLDAEGNLSPELRIFALIRLGITENEDIAKFLNISVKTVYSYKGKVKSKTIIQKEEFEYRIRNIPKDY